MSGKNLISILTLLGYIMLSGQPAIAKMQSPLTETIYLSGSGCDNMKEWDFYCTGGRNSGFWTKIGVPSCWETQGFGTYQYGYGYNKWNKTPSKVPVADEQGIYRTTFRLPKEWKGRQIEIVFEAAMTDAEVLVNGNSAGEIHQGGFSPFRYDITDKVNFGKKYNRLEVKVSKESSDSDMNIAERRCDFWNFGGIIRPVYVESRPSSAIVRTAIDAGMDGKFTADCFLKGFGKGMTLLAEIRDPSGKFIAAKEVPVNSDSIRVDITCSEPNLWTAETPFLHDVVFSLKDKRSRTVHSHKERFGFRTIELRKGDGFFINGKRIKLKGVNRHSFRPESGRTLSYAKNLEDAILIKSMNMNAVRLSHYPADKEFYDICDSVGLYVIDELTGWQHPQKTEIGKKLVKEMVTRDANHPSVIIWASGNEGGFNYDLEPFFKRYDIQKRVVIYPWSIRNGMNTRHYRSWNEMKKYLGGNDIVMPTEFLHGLYDGGHGAGLYDYWNIMWESDICAGGFLWMLADEGVVRTDLGGKTDTKGCLGADGIVGPHHEKEGSYYTIKELWSPVRVTGLEENMLNLENRYDFLNLNTCRIGYRYLSCPTGNENMSMSVITSGTTVCPDALPREKTSLIIANIPETADFVEIDIIDRNDEIIHTWSKKLKTDNSDSSLAGAFPTFKKTDSLMVIESCGRKYSFGLSDGFLKSVDYEGRRISLSDGPRLVAARRADRKADSLDVKNRKKALATTDYHIYPDSSVITDIEFKENKLSVTYCNGYLNSVEWTFLENGKVSLSCDYTFDGVADLLGIMFDYPEKEMISKKWLGNGPFRVWQNRIHGPRFGLWETEYNDPVPGKSFDYPEFKGYFSDIERMDLNTSEGRISIMRPNGYIGVFTPRDGSDNYLYDLPESGISILDIIPAVRNKVDYSDLNGPSAQPHLCTGSRKAEVTLKFE